MINKNIYKRKNRLRKLFLYYSLPVLTENSIERLELYLKNVKDEMERLNSKAQECDSYSENYL